MRRTRTSSFVAAGGIAAGLLLAAPPAAASPPTAFEVEFPERSCTSVADSVTGRLSVRVTDRRQPDGTVHHWLDIAGTLTNDVTGDHVTLRLVRRFFDDEADDQSRFAGLQSRFSAPGHGTLHLNAGWASGALSESVATYATRGRWDGISDALPDSVCSVLAGDQP